MQHIKSSFLAHYVDHMDIAAVVHQHPDPILVVNSQNEVLYTNTAGSRLLCRLPNKGSYLPPELNGEPELDGMTTITDVIGKEMVLKINIQAIQWTGFPARLFTLYDMTTYSNQYRELEQQLYSDHLTGLYNSRGLEVVAEHIRNVSRRKSQAISAFYIDVNGLKQINDTNGHSVGDKVIIEIAEVIVHSFRDADVRARVGGDEFVVLLIDDSDKSIEALMTRLRSEIDRRNAMPDRCYTLSISIGVGRYAEHQDFNIQQLINEADHRMYLAKQNVDAGNVRQCNHHWPLSSQ